MLNLKRNNAIYEQYKQGIKTSIIIKKYNISRQRMHQIIKQVGKSKEEKQKIFQEIKEAKQCGACYFYNSNGFCSHNLSKDFCADRDSTDSCNIDKFKYHENC